MTTASKNADTLTSSATRSRRNYKYPIFVILSTKPFTIVRLNNSLPGSTQSFFCYPLPSYHGIQHSSSERKHTHCFYFFPLQVK